MVPLTRLARGVAALGALALLGPSPAGAQAGALVPLDDPVYQLVDALRARGGLRTLSALERPYRLGAIDSALVRDDSAGTAGRDAGLRRALRGWLDALAGSAEGDGVRLYGSLTLGAAAQTTGRRELMLAAEDDRATGVPFAHPRLAIDAGPVVAVLRARVDGGLKEDPEFVGKKDRITMGRIEDGYAQAHWRYGELFLGRTARNLGPASLPGLQLGSSPYSYDHLFARIGVRRLHLLSLVAPLDPYRFGATGDDARAAAHLPAPRRYDYETPYDSVAQRWFALHRFGLSIGGIELGLTEATVWGGVDRGFEAGLANPLGFWTLSQYSERQSHNSSLGADVAWTTGRFGTFAAQAMLDDVQIDDCALACQEPTAWAGSLAAEGVPLPLGLRGFGSYMRVSNLSYRTYNVWERYASYDVGLGAAQADFDELRAGVELATGRAVIRPYVAVRRQGEGDYRLAYPAVEDYPTTPGFLAGRVWRTTRVGASGVAWLGRSLWLQADLGYSHATDVLHVAGRDEAGLEGRVRLAFRTPNARLLVAR